MDFSLLTKAPKQWIRDTFGVWPALEFGNKLLMAHRIPRLLAFEDAEVRRLSAQLPRPAEATVACVVPTYKRPEQLIMAVESILNQDYQDFVIVIVDDGAGLPPNLPDDPRVFASSLSRNSAVLGIVRNVGIRLSKSKYIAFLDDDNTWTPDHLKLTVAALEAGADFVYTSIRRRTANGAEFDVISHPFDRRLLADGSNYIDANSIAVRRQASTLFSRLPRIKQTYPKEDWEFAYRCTRNAKVTHIDTPTVEYLINFDSYYTTWSGDE